MVHEEGYTVERRLDGALEFRRPDGRAIPDIAPRIGVPADPVGAMRADNGARGLSLSPRTACPAWLGQRLDLGYALDVLHPLAGNHGNGATTRSPDAR
jgi:hypothetical protein